MAKLFFLLSGEHPTLPAFELRSILEAEGYEHRVLKRLPQVLRVEADVRCVETIASRAAMTRVCGTELFQCSAIIEEICEEAGSAPLEEFIGRSETFVVRVKRVRGVSPRINRGELERKLGEIILNRVKGVKVNLREPRKVFFGVLTRERFVFGTKIAEISPKAFVERRPHKRPFFHPAAIPAKIARCMVNLAQPKRGELLLDPFCGTASILVEAGLMGVRVVGLDAKRRMIVGGLQNLLYYGITPEGMAVADARRPPVTRVDCVVTDPPYGRSATTLGLTTGEVVYGMLREVIDVLPRGGRICMASPKTVRVGRIGRELGLEHVKSHFLYVHRSLTREIAVFERT